MMETLALDDPRWESLAGLYGSRYDPRPTLRRLAAGEPPGKDTWAEFWQELHHQGDVSVLSYATLVALVNSLSRAATRGWNFYGLAATIELQRLWRANPQLPAWLEPFYHHAWTELLALALDDLRVDADALAVRTALAVVAFAKGSPRLGALLIDFDESELEDMLKTQIGWDTLYAEGRALHQPALPA